MSKTERALDEDEAALDELDDFVASEAAEADRAIGELIDEAVVPRNGSESAVEETVDGNGFDTADIDRPVHRVAAGAVEDDRAGVEAVVDDEAELLDVDELELAADEHLAGGEVEVPEAVDVEPADDDAVGLDVDVELDDEVATDSFELLHLEQMIETDDGIVDDEALSPAPAAPEPDVVDEDADASVADVEALDDGDDGDVDDEAFELPEIVPATADEPDAAPSGNGSTPASGTVLHPPAGLTPPAGHQLPIGREVSDDILEELRRADIDGPIVDFAPQDDTTSAKRRPKRSPDYDPAPVPIPARPPRVLGRKPRVRKVTRVVRHVDPWSVFKIAVMANLVLYVILLTAGVLLWNVAHATGTVDNVERFFESFGWSTFEFNGGEIYHAAWIGGLFAVVGFTGLAVLAATLFNLITDIVGGMRFTVLEEEVVETRTSPMRRFVVRRPEPEVPAVIRDRSGPMIREAVVDDSGAIER